MKLIKTRIRNRIGQSSLSYLMKIAIETPEKLSDSDLDAIISVWNRKPRRIAYKCTVLLFLTLLLYLTFTLLNLS